MKNLGKEVTPRIHAELCFGSKGMVVNVYQYPGQNYRFVQKPGKDTVQPLIQPRKLGAHYVAVAWSDVPVEVLLEAELLFKTVALEAAGCHHILNCERDRAECEKLIKDKSG